jgi:hypothetical protein
MAPSFSEAGKSMEAEPREFHKIDNSQWYVPGSMLLLLSKYLLNTFQCPLALALL